MKNELMNRDVHEYVMHDQAKRHRSEKEALKMQRAGDRKRGELDFYEYIICSDLTIVDKEKIVALWRRRHGDARVESMTPIIKEGDAVMYDKAGKAVMVDGEGNQTMFETVAECLRAMKARAMNRGLRMTQNPKTHKDRGEAL